jgi:hypothetical protein
MLPKYWHGSGLVWSGLVWSGLVWHWQGFAVLVMLAYQLDKIKPLECQSRGFKGFNFYSLNTNIKSQTVKAINRAVSI